MPRFDGTGPEGAGPMTGRAAGRCNDAAPQTGAAQYGAQGNWLGRGFRFMRGLNPVRWFGRGGGRGRGRGRRW